MNARNQQDRDVVDHASFKESRTARFNLPVRHPGLWRFLLDQLVAPAIRVGRYRDLTTRMLEESTREIGRGQCHE